MNKLKERLIRLNISFRKELIRYIIIAVVLMVVFIVVSILTKNYFLFIVMVPVLLGFTYLYVSRYKAMEDKRKQNDLLEFVNLFAFFRIYLKNGLNVYSALKEMVNFANQNLRELLQKLVDEIDENKSVEPFIKFARYFNNLLVEEMMVSVYQIIDDGSDSNHLVQFELIYDKFSETLQKERLNAKDKSLANLTVSALVGSAYLITVVTVGIILILGDMMNGL